MCLPWDTWVWWHTEEMNELPDCFYFPVELKVLASQQVALSQKCWMTHLLNSIQRKGLLTHIQHVQYAELEYIEVISVINRCIWLHLQYIYKAKMCDFSPPPCASSAYLISYYPLFLNEFLDFLWIALHCTELVKPALQLSCSREAAEHWHYKVYKVL